MADFPNSTPLPKLHRRGVLVGAGSIIASAAPVAAAVAKPAQGAPDWNALWQELTVAEAAARALGERNRARQERVEAKILNETVRLMRPLSREEWLPIWESEITGGEEEDLVFDREDAINSVIHELPPNSFEAIALKLHIIRRWLDVNNNSYSTEVLDDLLQGLKSHIG